MTALSPMPNDDVYCTLEDHRCPFSFNDIRRLITLFSSTFALSLYLLSLFLDSELILLFMRVHYQQSPDFRVTHGLYYYYGRDS